jgi:hypothetical protein
MEWERAPYEVVIFHRESLSKGDQALINYLQKMSAINSGPVNIEVRVVALTEELSPEDKKRWQEYAKGQKIALPRMVLYFPAYLGLEKAIWSAPLTKAAIELLVNSPTREKIKQRILKGASIVWVVLESGERRKDTQVIKLLKATLKELKKSLTLPTPFEAEDEIPGVPLKLDFPLLRLAQGKKREEVLIRILSQIITGEQKKLTLPAIFPIFGRGRALCSLTGKEITKEEIEDVCVFLTGDCSCEIKMMDPGIDLLMAVNWGKELWPPETPEVEHDDVMSDWETSSRKLLIGVIIPTLSGAIVGIIFGTLLFIRKRKK